MARIPEYGGRAPDALNPLAVSYARHQLAAHGVRVPAGQDPTALWRALSASIYQGRPPLGRRDVNLSGDAYANGGLPALVGAATGDAFSNSNASSLIAALRAAAGNFEPVPHSRPVQWLQSPKLHPAAQQLISYLLRSGRIG